MEREEYAEFRGEMTEFLDESKGPVEIYHVKFKKIYGLVSAGTLDLENGLVQYHLY